MDKNIIETMGLLADDVYSDELFVVGKPMRQAPGYQVLAISPPSSNGFQALLLERADPQTAGSKYVFAFRGTQVDKNHPIETWLDTIQTDVLGMGLRDVPAQFLEAILFVQEQMRGNPDIAVQNTTLTGHSLGGSLATAVSYVFGFQAYGYNPFGIAKNDLFSAATIGDVFKKVVEDILPFYAADPTSVNINTIQNTTVIHAIANDLGIDVNRLISALNSSAPVSDTLGTNINVVAVGADYQELVSGALTDIVGGLIGDFQPIVEHKDTFLGGFFSHGIAALNKNISIYNNVLSLFPDDDYRALTDIISSVPSKGNQVHRVLVGLAELLQIADADSLDSPVLSEKLAQHTGLNLSLTALANLTPGEIAFNATDNSATGLAYRYALTHLNPFVVLGNASLYASHNQNGELDQYDPSNGQGALSNNWVHDRAKMLYWQMKINTEKAEASFSHPYVKDSAPAIRFVANDMGREIVLGNKGVGGSDRRQILFGANASDLLEGGNSFDHLYGMGGNDKLKGLAGNDYLEGGEGSDVLNGGRDDDILDGGTGVDTYVFQPGSGNDTLIDSDRKGRIVLADADGKVVDVAAGSFSRVAPGTDQWASVSGNFTLTKGDNWVITLPDGSTIDLGTEFNSGDFGIDINDPAPAPVVKPPIGDDNANLIADLNTVGQEIHAQGGRDMVVGSTGNDLLDGGSGDDWIIGRGEADTIEGGSGNDLISWIGGGSVVDAGEGDDIVAANMREWFYISQPNNPITADAVWDDVSSHWQSGHTDGLRKGENGEIIVPLWGGAQLGTYSGDSVLGDGWTYTFTLSNDGFEIVYTHPTKAPKGISPGASWEHEIQSNPSNGLGVMLDGGRGNDLLIGNEGDDVISGGRDKDFLLGNGGNDLLDGNEGNDSLAGGIGDDTLLGGLGQDQLYGETGDDYLDGQEEADTIVGGGGSDLLFGGAGKDELYGDSFDTPDTQQGDDYLDGGANDDLLVGYGGADVLLGGAGNDTLDGDAGDLAAGLHGDDLLDGGVGQDVLIGNGGADLLFGGADDDTLFGDASDTPEEAMGDDTLDGGIGNDTLIGSGGNDILIGGDGDDVLDGDTSGLSADLYGNDVLDGGAGNDILVGRGGNDTLTGGDGQDELYGGAGQDNLSGGLNNDTLYGNAGDDYLQGGQGDDLLVGADGDDQLAGGDGNDSLYGDAIDTTGNDILAGGEGDDYLYGGSGDDDLSGDGGDDVLVGEGGNDLLAGGAGNDEIWGGSGNDHLLGGEGEDLLVAGSGEDVVDGGAGQDIYLYERGSGRLSILDAGSNTLRFGSGISSDSLTLGLGSLLIRTGAEGDEIHIENFNPNDVFGQYAIDRFEFADGTVLTYEDLIARGFDLSGTDGDDVIEGTSAKDRLEGFAGNDTIIAKSGDDLIDGGTGADTMYGNQGDDVFIVDDAGDQVEELAGEGTDEVRSSLGYTLGAHVENLTLTETATQGIGNELNNQLTGNAGDNSLEGLAGDDTLIGQDGDDQLYGGEGADNLEGGAGNDLLDGGAGSDILSGRSGDDQYIVDDAGDYVHETYNQGHDSVTSSVSLQLSANVEDLELTGNDNLSGKGNGSANTIIGNAGDNSLEGLGGNDILAGQAGNDALSGGDGDDSLSGGDGDDLLDGGSGSDSMSGGAGNDTYRLDNAGDTIIEQTNQGIDTVEAGFSTTLSDNLENLTLTGSAISGTGNTLNNHIKGNNFSNTLDGGTGADLLEGGSGNDTYIVDDQGDQVVEQLYGGHDKVLSSSNHTLSANVEDLTLTGTAAVNGTGNDLNNLINGNVAANTLAGGGGTDWLYGQGGDDQLYGEAGNDLLVGGLGADLMAGGTGSDTYVVDDTGDQVVENTGEGFDQVHSSVSHTLSDNLENLYLSGSASINGAGNALDNLIQGNSGSNILSGGAGNDTLDGGYGNDTLVGGADNDSYRVDSSGDQIIEAAGEGYDRVDSDVSYTLSDHVEQLNLVGSYAYDGTGNDQDNVIIGNDNNNRLEGAGGNDDLDGAAGDDILTGGDGNDILYGGDDSESGGYDPYGGDYSYGGYGGTLTNNDHLDGGAGDDDLDGGSGDDVLFGGDGDDILYGGDDGTGGGYSSYGGYYDYYTGYGGSIDTLTNNDHLDGGTGNDTLDGGSGDDVLLGGEGDDILYGGDDGQGGGYDPYGGDYSYGGYGGTVGNDDILDGGSGDDLLSGGTGNDQLQGGEGTDSLDGGFGDDVLDGGLGIDTMAGGSGNDIYYVDGYAEVTVIPGNDGVDGTGSGHDCDDKKHDHKHDDNDDDHDHKGNEGVGNGQDAPPPGHDHNMNDGPSTEPGHPGHKGKDKDSSRNEDHDDHDNDHTSSKDDSRDGDSCDDSGDKDHRDNKNHQSDDRGDDDYGDRDHDGKSGRDNEHDEDHGRDDDHDDDHDDDPHSDDDHEDKDDCDRGHGDGNGTGAGYDELVITNYVTDKVVEQAGGGYDRVYSSITYGLTDHVEDLTLIGTDNLDGTGNDLANQIVGNSGNNRLDGGRGNDRMFGGLGDDTYVVDSLYDQIFEFSGEGLDRVEAAINYTLGDHLESLTLAGTEALTGVGNAGDNSLTGNRAKNLLQGLGGNDILSGGRGDDVLEGGDGNDSYLYARSDGLDVIKDTKGQNVIRFGEGITRDDIAIHILEDDQVAQIRLLDGHGSTLNEGMDVVLDNGALALAAIEFADGSLVLPDELMVLSKKWKGTDSKDRIVAGAENDIIKVKDGNDKVFGGSGNDLIRGGQGKDTLSGEVGHDQLYGGADNDKLSGGYGNDLLKGGQGNDRLDGGVGDDILKGGAGNDTYLFARGDGLDQLKDTDGTNVIRFAPGISQQDVAIRIDKEDGKKIAQIRLRDAHGSTLDEGIDAVLKKGAYPFSGLEFAEGSTATPENLLVLSEKWKGTKGSDLIKTGRSDDTIKAKAGDDRVESGLGNDRVYGMDGNDHVEGEGGHDKLYGDAGNDKLSGGYGNDLLIGGTGDDLLEGGAGSDTYLFSLGDGQDRIELDDDDCGSGGDKIHLAGDISADSVALFRSGKDLEIGYGVNDRIVVDEFFDDDHACQLASLELADGRYLQGADIERIVQQMSAYAVQEGISLNYLDDVRQDDIITTVVANSWQAA